MWEKILDRVSDSKDFRAVLLSFPELDRHFESKKVDRIFDQVLPLLMTKYFVTKRVIRVNDYVRRECEVKELMQLRLVSKRWKCAVDLSLRNHVDRNISGPTEIGNTLDRQLSINGFNYNRMVNIRFGVTVFKSDKHITRFLKDMRGCNGNPFPGSYVFLKSSENSVVKKCVELFQRLGKYVHVLEIELLHLYDNLEVCQNILKCLTHVKNLRSLTFTGEYNCEADWRETSYFCKPESQKLFPKLPNLEIFEWRIKECSTLPLGWLWQLLLRYGGGSQIHKLRMDTRSIPDLLSGLSGLTELHLKLYWVENWNITLSETLTQILSTKNQLETFVLTTKPYYMDNFDIILLIKVIANLEIKNLVLEDMYLEEKTTTVQSLSPKLEILSITSLRLEDSLRITYGFLKMMPNLQFLHIYFTEFARKKGYEDSKISIVSQPKRSSFGVKIRGVFQKANRAVETQLPLAKRLRACILGAYVNDSRVFEHLESIWKELPKLQTLTGSVEVPFVIKYNGFGVQDVRFERECGRKVFVDENPTYM